MAISIQEYEQAIKTTRSDDALVLDELERLFHQSDEKQGRTVDAMSQVDARSHKMTGQRVGPYQVIETLGHGGMGVVYLAHDTHLARKAALKAILPGAERETAPLERLRREARVLA